MQRLYFTDACLGKVGEGKVDLETHLSISETVLNSTCRDVNGFLSVSLGYVL